jgi:hypothetical protein
MPSTHDGEIATMNGHRHVSQPPASLNENAACVKGVTAPVLHGRTRTPHAVANTANPAGAVAEGVGGVALMSAAPPNHRSVSSSDFRHGSRNEAHHSVYPISRTKDRPRPIRGQSRRLRDLRAATTTCTPLFPCTAPSRQNAALARTRPDTPTSVIPSHRRTLSRSDAPSAAGQMFRGLYSVAPQRIASFRTSAPRCHPQKRG